MRYEQREVRGESQSLKITHIKYNNFNQLIEESEN